MNNSRRSSDKSNYASKIFIALAFTVIVVFMFGVVSIDNGWLI